MSKLSAVVTITQQTQTALEDGRRMQHVSATSEKEM